MKKNPIYYLSYLAFTIITISQPVFSQQLVWNHLGGPMGGTVGDMAINSKGHIYSGVYTNVFTSQSYEGIYKSTDNGDSWFKLKNTVDQFEVYAIFINRLDHIFVGTNYRDRLYRSTDEGETWEIINNGYNTAECWAIGENKDGTVMFAGDGQFGYLFRSTNYGLNWELSANLPVLAFAVDSINNVYCGTHIGLYKSTDDGLSWNQIGFNNIAVNTILIGEADTIFCGTGYYDNGQGVYYSPDYGNTWTSMGLNDKIILSLAFTNHGSLLAGSGVDGVFETTDLGNNWIQHNNGLYNKQAFRLEVNNNDDIFVGSEFEGVFRSMNGGESFEHIGLPISGIFNIEFLEDSLIIAGTIAGVQKYNKITGEWSNIGLHVALAVETDIDGNIYAATNGGGLYQSTDLGKSWINICQSPYILNVKKINNVILAATDTGLIMSTNNGINWEGTPVRSGVENCAIEINKNGDIWAAGFMKLYKSADGGLTFDSTNNINFRYIDRNNLYINNNFIFFGDRLVGRGIHYSTDYGNTWQNIYYHRTINSVNGNGSYIIAGTYKDILYSFDQGLTLDSIPYPDKFYGRVQEIEYDNTGMLYFGTSSQGLYQMDFIVNVEDEEPVNKGFVLYPLYPNPFNSTATVKFNLSRASIFKITLYNTLGEKIKTIEGQGEKGLNEKNISFENLTSGIYLVVVEGIDFFAVRKAALIK
jgi:photosystem II stability/assembly factor-like uncharacterized protein